MNGGHSKKNCSAEPWTHEQIMRCRQVGRATWGLVAVAGVGMIAAHCRKSTCWPCFLCCILLITSLYLQHLKIPQANNIWCRHNLRPEVCRECGKQQSIRLVLQATSQYGTAGDWLVGAAGNHKEGCFWRTSQHSRNPDLIAIAPC